MYIAVHGTYIYSLNSLDFSLGSKFVSSGRYWCGALLHVGGTLADGTVLESTQ